MTLSPQPSRRLDRTTTSRSKKNASMIGREDENGANAGHRGPPPRPGTKGEETVEKAYAPTKKSKPAPTAERLRTAVEEIFPRVNRLAARLTGGGPDADDLAQEAIRRVLERSEQYEQHENPRALVLRVLRNLFIDAQRRRWGQKPLDERTLSTLAAESPAPAGGEIWDPMEWVTTEEVLGALEGLKPEFKEVFELAELERLSHRDIAARLSISTRTVATRLFRARRKLRLKILQNRGGGQHA